MITLGQANDEGNGVLRVWNIHNEKGKNFVNLNIAASDDPNFEDDSFLEMAIEYAQVEKLYEGLADWLLEHRSDITNSPLIEGYII